MKSREIEPQKKVWFIVLSSVTIIIVFTGWFFSFRDVWRATNLSFSFSKVTEVKDGVSEIASDFKEETQKDTAVLEPVIDQAAEALREKQKQEAAAKEEVGEIMKEQLDGVVGGSEGNEGSEGGCQGIEGVCPIPETIPNPDSSSASAGN